jgi:hypothetical protein
MSSVFVPTPSGIRDVIPPYPKALIALWKTSRAFTSRMACRLRFRGSVMYVSGRWLIEQQSSGDKHREYAE